MRRLHIGSPRFSVIGLLAALAARVSSRVVVDPAMDTAGVFYQSGRTSPRKNAQPIVAFLPPTAGFVPYPRKPHLRRLGLRAWAGRL